MIAWVLPGGYDPVLLWWLLVPISLAGYAIYKWRERKMVAAMPPYRLRIETGPGTCSWRIQERSNSYDHWSSMDGGYYSALHAVETPEGYVNMRGDAKSRDEAYAAGAYAWEMYRKYSGVGHEIEDIALSLEVSLL